MMYVGIVTVSRKKNNQGLIPYVRSMSDVNRIFKTAYAQSKAMALMHDFELSVRFVISYLFQKVMEIIFPENTPDGLSMDRLIEICPDLYFMELLF